MNIFEQLNVLLSEAKESPKAEKSDIPIHPEMETEEQGKIAAYEKIRKLFQKLSMGSGGTVSINNRRPEIPDDIIDPMFKEPPKSVKDKTFDKNKLVGWDEEPEDKIEKEVDLEKGGEEDDEFDDFDYRDNPFGDEDDDENDTQDFDEDDRSEDEKLRDNIKDAIDSLDDDKDDFDSKSGGNGEDEDDSGANWNFPEDEGYPGPQGGQQGGKQGGEDGGYPGPQGGPQGGQQGGGTPNSGQGSVQSQTNKQKRLEDLKKSLDSKGMKDFRDKMDDIKKNTTDNTIKDDSIAGQINTPTDETFKDEMEKSGFDKKRIDEMNRKKNEKSGEDYNESEIDEIKKKIIDGLEHSCEEKGGSALASTIVKTAVKKKLNNDEWTELLKLFLKAKSINKGKLSTNNKGIGWGHKNHLWRDAVLPKSTPSKGTIQNIYCFVDFSGSVNKDLVYTFLGKVIDLCSELKYTDVKVYGFATTLSLPRTLDSRSLSKGNDVALSQTWDFINEQNLDGGTENFYEVTEEINKIKRKEKDAIILIFGDAFWESQTVGPKCLRYEIDNTMYLDDICALTYFSSMNSRFVGCINLLKEIVGLKHVITTKASSIKE